jgi:hypothetical protein
LPIRSNEPDSLCTFVSSPPIGFRVPTVRCAGRGPVSRRVSRNARANMCMHMRARGEHFHYLAHGLGLGSQAIEAGVEFQDSGALGVEVAPGLSCLRPELGHCRIVRLKFGHFGHNAGVQLENQRLLGVQLLPFPPARDPFENEHMIAGCGHCQDVDPQ